MEWVLLLLIGLSIPVMGVAGFVMALNARRRITELERKVVALTAGAALAVPPATDRPEEQAPSTAAAAPEAAPPTDLADEEEEGEDRSLVAGARQPQPAGEEPAAPLAAREGLDEHGNATPPLPRPEEAKAPRPSLEEQIGTRWAVWLGGVALALGGLFLVRYAIDQGFFGPTARVISGALFAAALLAAGEWMRRRDAGSGAAVIPLGALPPAPIPAVLTAAGTLSAFGTAYAAHALYDMIGPATAFVLLGAIGLGTMAAAALHGPWLAGLGLAAAFVAPVLVSSAEPRPWPVVIYIAIVAAAAYALSRLRLWLWLAIATAVGGLLWGVLIIEGAFRNHVEAMVHVVVQAGLAALFLGWDAHRRDADARASFDPAATCILAAFALLAAYKLQVAGLGPGRPAFAFVMLALLWGTALRLPAVAASGLAGAAVVVAALFAWPVASEAAREPVTVLPGAPSNPPLPDALWQLLVLSLASGGILAAGAFVRLMRTPVIAPVATGLYAAAGVAGPLAILVTAWWTVSDFEQSIPFALAAGFMAVAFVAAAAQFRGIALAAPASPPAPRPEPPIEGAMAETGEAAAAPVSDVDEPAPSETDFAVVGHRSARFGLEACAAGALAALAAGLTMVLDKGGLTVALALSAAGAAWVTTREPVGTLRYAVGVLGVAVLGRLVWDPTIVGGEIGGLPVLNWLLWGYGVPALAFGLASVWLRRQKDDQVVALCEALSIAFTALLLMTEIRHAVTGTLDDREPGHVETGLQAFASLVHGGVLVWLEITRRSTVIRIGSYVMGGLGLGASVFGLVLAVNPLLSGSERVAGGAVFNSLLPGYLMPALAALGLALVARERRPRWFQLAAMALAFVLQFLWMVMLIRHLYQGERIVLWRPTGDAELYTYSAAFLVMGLALLAFGVVRQSRTARLASGLYVLLTVGKVFLVDMDGLTGVWRALSFIGLGLALVGIGLVYQKLVFGRRPAAPPPAPGPAA
ncbi:DUF2339 domain-containing protein [Alsobacter sp. R-9]